MTGMEWIRLCERVCTSKQDSSESVLLGHRGHYQIHVGSLDWPWSVSSGQK